MRSAGFVGVLLVGGRENDRLSFGAFPSLAAFYKLTGGSNPALRWIEIGRSTGTTSVELWDVSDWSDILPEVDPWVSRLR